MRCITTISVFEIVNCFLDVSFKNLKFISILHIPQTIPLFQPNYILCSLDFFYVPAIGQYTMGEGGMARKKTQEKGERRNERHKSSENAKESEIISVKKVLILTADLSPKWWVVTSDRTGQNSLKLVHSLLKSGHDRKKDQK